MNISNLIFIFPAIIGVGFLIGFHELGHYLFCKLFNIHTPSFSIGFGPKLISRQIGDTEFSLSAIPLGGYVEIAGAAEVGQGDQSQAFSTDERSFARKPYYQKMLVMFGGIMFNLIFAYTALILLYSAGIPSTIPTIAHVEPESSAAHAGLQPGDTIIGFSDLIIDKDVQSLIRAIQESPDKEATLTFTRNGQIMTTAVTPKGVPVMDKQVGSLGASFEMSSLPGLSLKESISQGIALANKYIKNTVYAFTHLLKSRDTTGMGGPIRIIQETASGAAKGFKIFFFFLAIISINLAVLNLIPLPILDGGQILFYTIEAAIRRPLPYQIREYIHIASWIGILLLTLFLTYKDLIAVVTKMRP
jgi:regulator of sigma E protease